MTRENFKDIISKIVYPDVNDIIKQLEVLGLLKFEEEKEVKHYISFNRNQFCGPDQIVKLEEWPEGLVLWVGGEIKWKSWEKIAKIGDYVDIDWYDYPATNKVYTGQIRKIK